MAYITLYRAYRPQNFSEIVGQVHISQTLKNAVINNRVAHAYLFCGPRGTGKTSTAKVLAKAINCLNGEVGEPCNSCNVCKAVNDNLSYDVIEIDGASNRGIDEIRDLKEKVNLAPAEAKFKVYIIDEVHMLTTEAFNALLKTLEEPPKHVVFILATTEPHKVPLTILSRCQRFDFHRLTTNVILDHLQKVCDKNQIHIQSEALYLIARAADGGMRDGLSILDQAITFSGDQITVEHVNLVIGTVEDQVLLNFADKIVAKDVSSAIKILNEVADTGKDLGQFVWGLMEHYRNLLLIKSGDREAIFLPEEFLNLLLEQADRYLIEDLLQIIETLAILDKELKWSSNPKILIEMNVVKLCRGLGGISVTSLLNRIKQLEHQLTHGNPNYQLSKDTVNYKDNAQEPAQLPIEQPIEKSIEKEPKLVPISAPNIKDMGKHTLEHILAKWREVLTVVKKANIATHAFLVEAKPAYLEEDKLTLLFNQGYSFHCEKIQQPDNKKILEQAITKVVGKKHTIICKLNEDTGFQEDVNKAIQIFGEQVVQIKDN